MKYEIFKWIIPVPLVAAVVSATVSLVIAYFTIKITKGNIKKQIRVGRLEEISEILLFFTLHYPMFKSLYDSEENATRFPTLLNDYMTKLKEVDSILTLRDVQSKLARFHVLIDSYLPDKSFKSDAWCIYDLIDKITVHGYERYNAGTKAAYSDGYPSEISFKKTCEEIQKDVIKEMELGFSGADWKELKIYRDTKFKEKLEKNYIDMIARYIKHENR